jgi:hypothetical protein
MHNANCYSSLWRLSGAMLLVASFSMLAACGGGPEAAGAGGAGAAITCANGGNSANLTWNAIADPDLAGYRVYYGTTSGTYLQPRGQGVDVPATVAANVTNFTVMGLASGTTYFFAITAYGNTQFESDFSNEVCKTTS